PLSGLVVHLCGGCGYVEPPNACPIPENAPLPGRRAPPPQNETTDTGQVDRYQREQAYDGTQMVCDDRALAYRLVHRVIQRRALPKQGLRAPFDRQGSALPPKKRTKLISVPVDGVNLRVVLL